MSDPEKMGFTGDMPDYGDYEEEVPIVTLSGVVGMETLLAAGFNFAEISTIIYNEGNCCRVYIVDENDFNPNLVVVEEEMGVEQGQGTKFYFGTFRGIPIGQRRGEDAVSEYMAQVRGILASENEVPADELEDIIDSFAMEYFDE